VKIIEYSLHYSYSLGSKHAFKSTSASTFVGKLKMYEKPIYNL